MTLLIIIASIIVYGCAGAVVCGVYDDFFNINNYVVFWPVIVIRKTFESLFKRKDIL